MRKVYMELVYTTKSNAINPNAIIAVESSDSDYLDDLKNKAVAKLANVKGLNPKDIVIVDYICLGNRVPEIIE